MKRERNPEPRANKGFIILQGRWMYAEPVLISDERLVMQTLTGDDKAFAHLVQRYFDRVYLIAYARLGSREEAEDLAQEVFLRIYLNLDQFDPQRRFAHWICRIAHNLSCDWLRGKRYRTRILSALSLDEDDLAQMIPDPQSPNPRNRLAEQEDALLLREAIMKLPADMREIILLRYIEDLNNREIAEHLGIHPSTVGRLHEKALHLLRSDLEPMLRGLRSEFQPPVCAAARTLGALAAAATLSLEAKSSLAAGAASLGKLALDASAASVVPAGFLLAAKASAGSLWQTLAGLLGFPFKLLLLNKMLGVPVLVAALLGGAWLVAQDYGLRFSDFFPRRPVPKAAAVADSAPPAPADVPVAAPWPAPAPPPVAVQPSRPMLLEQAARAAGVQIVAIEEQPGGARITVAWRSDRADLGSNFLEAAVRNGAIRDFSLTTGLASQIVNGQRVTRGQYTVSY